MTRRLTISMRKEILQSMLDFRFSGEIKCLEEERLTLGDIFYNGHYSEDTRALFFTHKHLFGCADHVCIKYNGNYLSIYFSKGIYRPVGQDLLCKAHVINEESEYGRIIVKYFKDKDSINKTIKKVSHDIMSILLSAKTVKELIAIWPESSKFIPVEEDKKCTALSMPVGEINKELGFSAIQKDIA